jgi:cytochrome P450
MTTAANERESGNHAAAPPPSLPAVVRGYPLIGCVADVLRDGPGFLARVARERPGEVAAFRLGPVTVYLVTHPDHVQRVLVEDRQSFTKGGMWRGTKAVLGNGLVASEGELWARQRRLMQPLFTTARLAALADQMVEVVGREVEALRARGPGARVDMAHEMGALTQRVILETMFGPGIDRAETDRLSDQLLVAFQGMNLRLFLYFLPERLPLPDERRFRRAIAAIDEALLRLVRARRAEGSERDDLLSLLLHARDEVSGEGMDERQIRDELVTMFAAGNDTTANAMTWLWVALSLRPAVEQRLRAEVAEVLGDRRPTHADLARLSYTKLVVQETLRLYPAVWMFPRFAAVETILGPNRIPAGSPILLSPIATHRDPALWPDPETFDPERFTPERSAGRPRYAYYPFGGGPRQCIGNHFALMEAQIITAMMVQRLRPRLLPGHRVELSSASTLKPRGGLPVTLDPA